MERQRLNRHQGKGAYMEPAADGNWVAYSDAADLLLMHTREIEKLNARLALAVAEVRAWRGWFDAERTIELNEPLMYQDAVNARAATDADPVLRAMVEKGSVT